MSPCFRRRISRSGRDLPRDRGSRRLRRAYRIAWLRHFGPRDYLRIALGWLLWPLIGTALAVRSGIKLGGPVARAGGPSVLRQIGQQIRLALCTRIMPRYYYIFELHRPELRRRAAEYLTRVETKSGIYRALKQRGDRSKFVRINDKLAFATFFARSGLRVVPVFAAFRAGLRVGNVGDGTLPEGQDLFVKMIEGRGGVGAERWQAQPHGRYRNSRGEERTAEDLVSLMLELSKQDDCLIQARVVNDPAIADLTPGRLIDGPAPDHPERAGRARGGQRRLPHGDQRDLAGRQLPCRRHRGGGRYRDGHAWCGDRPRTGRRFWLA